MSTAMNVGLSTFWRTAWRRLFSSQKTPANFSRWLESQYRAIGIRDASTFSLMSIQIMQECILNAGIRPHQNRRQSSLQEATPLQNRDASSPVPLKLEYSDDEEEEEDDSGDNKAANAALLSPPPSKVPKLTEVVVISDDDDDNDVVFGGRKDLNNSAYQAERADASAALFEFLSSPEVSPSQSLQSSQEVEKPAPVSSVVQSQVTAVLQDTLADAKDDIVKRSRKRKRADWKVALGTLEDSFQVPVRYLAFLNVQPTKADRVEGSKLFEEAVGRATMSIHYGMNLFMIEKWIKGEPIRLFDSIFCDWSHLMGILDFIASVVVAPEYRAQLDQLYALSQTIGQYASVYKMLNTACDLMDWYTSQLEGAPHREAAKFLKERFRFFNYQIQQRDLPTALTDYIKNVIRLFFNVLNPVCNILLWRVTEDSTLWQTSQMEASRTKINTAAQAVKQDKHLLGRLVSFYNFAAWWLLEHQIPLGISQKEYFADDMSEDDDDEIEDDDVLGFDDDNLRNKAQLLQNFCKLCTTKQSSEEHAADVSTLEYYKEARDAAYVSEATGLTAFREETASGNLLIMMQKWRLRGSFNRSYGEPISTLFVYGQVAPIGLKGDLSQAKWIASAISKEAMSALQTLKKWVTDGNVMSSEVKRQLRNAVPKQVVVADPKIMKAISTENDEVDYQKRIISQQERFAKAVFKRVLADIIMD